MTKDSTPARTEAPPNVSALVVGIERYHVTGAGRGLWGSARLAARFARWLDEHRVCRTQRITLMTTYEETAYRNGASAALLSPGEVLAELENAGVNMLSQARTDQNLGDWINGSHGPKEDDELFVLFWIGHGFAFPDDPAERLCLLGSDADDYRLRNVELKDLLREVGNVAPNADVVAFVNACRAPVPAGWERKLERGQQKITTQQVREPRPRSQSVVYAAAHGETTKIIGRPDTTFAAELLNRLEALRVGAGPRTLFGEGLKQLVEDLNRDQVGLYWTTFGYWHLGGRLHLTPPPDENDLTHEEWQNLLKEAEAIDGSHDTERPVRWGAFCHAVGQDGPGMRPARLDSLRELILTLRDLPPRRPNLTPPLVVACDYVAHLPNPDSQPGLTRWCADWASRRGGDGRSRLTRAREGRPDRLPDRPYLSIEVNHVPEPPTPGRRSVKRYLLQPFLWTTSGPDWLEKRGPVPKEEIIAETAYAIGEAMDRDDMLDPNDLLVEFVLPRRLLGWWPEYEEPEQLGLHYAVVIRDQERLVGLDGKPAARRAANKLRQIAAYAPGQGARLSERIVWFTCDELDEPTKDRIVVAIRDHDKFCIVLGRRNLYALANGYDSDPPWELVESVRAGAAIIVSMQQESDCECRLRPLSLSSGGEALTCQMPEGRQLIVQKIDDADSWRNGFLDMPYILREIREELVEWRNRTGLRIGVLMEDPDRLWPGYFELKSGYRPASN